MKIFLSHSSRQKPLIREIRNRMPAHISTWLDEDKLLIGDDLLSSLESVIRSDCDYVLLFLDESAAKSPWVLKELTWAIETERTLGRNFLLPIVIDISAAENIDLGTRKYLSLKDFTESSMRSLSDSIALELFALICRDLQRSQNPKPLTASKALSEAEHVLSSTAALIRKAVFPHRTANPIAVNTLREVVNSHRNENLQEQEFDSLLSAIVQRNLICTSNSGHFTKHCSSIHNSLG